MTDKIEIIPELLTDLKEKAEKAMPGPWELDETPTDIATYYEIYSTDWMVADCEKDGASAAFITAANPAVVLGLIEKIERLEEDFEGAARSTADESVKAVKLEEEANWLAKHCEGEDQCPYLAFYRDFHGNDRPEWCRCLDNGEEFDCDEYVPDCWRKAAREAVEAQCKTD